tara:strand:+ start:248 stop:463 length:216 start_codon:yes stop_codon:yes gene_type:complete
MKGLKVDAIMPWELGCLLILIGIILIFLGNRQSKKTDIDLNKLPFIKPITKIIFGGAIILVGVIQLFPLLR